MVTRIIGIDPGDRWTGVAQLLIGAKDIVVGTFVIDGLKRRLNEVVDLAVGVKPAYVVAEEYRARPIGHQRFHAATTPKLLGAMEYKTILFKGQWSTIPAGSSKAVWSFPIGRLLKDWMPQWPRHTDKHWEHALSAWRVMMMSITKEQPQLHRYISDVDRKSMMLDEEMPSNVDLIAPFASWNRDETL